MTKELRDEVEVSSLAADTQVNMEKYNAVSFGEEKT